MAYSRYLRQDGSKTGWLEQPENETDKRIYSLSPLRRKYDVGETMEHRQLGVVECVSCERLINSDQCGNWTGPSYIAEFVRC